MAKPIKQLQVGQLVRSLAGHDKGQYYLVLKVAGVKVWLVDGYKRLPANANQKNTFCHGYSPILSIASNLHICLHSPQPLQEATSAITAFPFSKAMAGQATFMHILQPLHLSL